MFCDCSLLKDIKPLENWNVSNCKDFSSMFEGCSLLDNIKPLENWNISNCKDFSGMLRGCSTLKDINPFLEKWNLTKENNFKNIFIYNWF